MIEKRKIKMKNKQIVFLALALVRVSSHTAIAADVSDQKSNRRSTLYDYITTTSIKWANKCNRAANNLWKKISPSKPILPVKNTDADPKNLNIDASSLVNVTFEHPAFKNRTLKKQTIKNTKLTAIYNFGYGQGDDPQKNTPEIGIGTPGKS